MIPRPEGSSLGQPCESPMTGGPLTFVEGVPEGREYAPDEGGEGACWPWIQEPKTPMPTVVTGS